MYQLVVMIRKISILAHLAVVTVADRSVTVAISDADAGQIIT